MIPPAADLSPYMVQTGTGWFLRGTAWTGTYDRASIYVGQQAAQAALEKARKFMKPAAYKAARILPAET